jgi:hypothetical protein
MNADKTLKPISSFCLDLVRFIRVHPIHPSSKSFFWFQASPADLRRLKSLFKRYAEKTETEDKADLNPCQGSRISNGLNFG